MLINQKIKPPKESEIQSQVRDYLRMHGWYCIKIHQGLGCVKGVADLYCLKNGNQVWVEVKTKTGRLSEHQEKFKKDIIDHGGHYFIARSVDDVKIMLKMIV